jgi:hypothetical protein
MTATTDDLPRVAVVERRGVDEDGEDWEEFEAQCPSCGKWHSALAYAITLKMEGNDLRWPPIQCDNCKTEFRTKKAGETVCVEEKGS